MYRQTDQQTREMLAACGIVDRTKPATGVFSIHSLEFIYEDIESDSIDVDFECYCRDECPKDVDSCDCDYESMEPTYLIGFEYNTETGKYDIDENAEYSAIVNTDRATVQVVNSVWYLTGGLCSPCYPGQVDADSQTDDIPAYSVPPNVIGYDGRIEENALVDRVYLLEHRALIDDGLQIWNRADYNDYTRGNAVYRHRQNFYRVILSEHTAGLVVADNAQEALDIAIDHATEQTWEGLFLTGDDMDEIIAEHGEDCFMMDYVSGGNEGRYLSSLTVAIQALPDGQIERIWA